MQIILLLTPQQLWALSKYLFPALLLFIVVMVYLGTQDAKKTERERKEYAVRQAHQAREKAELQQEYAAVEAAARASLLHGPAETADATTAGPQTTATFSRLRPEIREAIVRDLDQGFILSAALLWKPADNRAKDREIEAARLYRLIKPHPLGKPWGEVAKTIGIRPETDGGFKVILSRDFLNRVERAKNLPTLATNPVIEAYRSGVFPEDLRFFTGQIRALDQLVLEGPNSAKVLEAQRALKNSLDSWTREWKRQSELPNRPDLATYLLDQIQHKPGSISRWQKAQPDFGPEHYERFVRDYAAQNAP